MDNIAVFFAGAFFGSLVTILAMSLSFCAHLSESEDSDNEKPR